MSLIPLRIGQRGTSASSTTMNTPTSMLTGSVIPTKAGLQAMAPLAEPEPEPEQDPEPKAKPKEEAKETKTVSPKPGATPHTRPSPSRR